MKTILGINILLLSIILIAVLTIDYDATIFLILNTVAGLLLFISLAIVLLLSKSDNKRIDNTKNYILSKYPQAKEFKFDNDNPRNKGIWYRMPNAKLFNFEPLH